MPAWLFGYALFGSGLYWGLQTFMPHQAAGWTAAAITVTAWFFIRRFRKRVEREDWAKQQAHRAYLESELAELEARRLADSTRDG